MNAIIQKDIGTWIRDGMFGRLGKYEVLVLIGVGSLEPLLMHTGRLVPIMALAFGLMASVGAFADSFAGERERGTLEVLFLSPISSRNLLVAKWVAGVVYCLAIGTAVGIGGFAVAALGQLRPAKGTSWEIAACLALFAVPMIAAILCVFSILAKESRQVLQFAMFTLLGLLILSSAFEGLLRPIFLYLASTSVLVVGVGVCAAFTLITIVALWTAYGLLRKNRGYSC